MDKTSNLERLKKDPVYIEFRRKNMAPCRGWESCRKCGKTIVGVSRCADCSYNYGLPKRNYTTYYL